MRWEGRCIITWHTSGDRNERNSKARVGEMRMKTESVLRNREGGREGKREAVRVRVHENWESEHEETTAGICI